MSAFAIEAEGRGLGTAVREGEVFRFYAAESALFALEKFVFVSLGDVVRAARRAHASQNKAKAFPLSRDVPRGTALARWQGLH